jgi:hypothetical protein
MEKYDEYDEDTLRKYLSSEKIEKAPEGFTSKTMARIRIEGKSVRAYDGIFRRNRILIVSAAVTLLLIAGAVLIPASEPDSVFSVILGYINKIGNLISGISPSPNPDFKLPDWTLYSIIGIALVGLLDRFLFSVFHREEKHDLHGVKS